MIQHIMGSIAIFWHRMMHKETPMLTSFVKTLKDRGIVTCDHLYWGLSLTTSLLLKLEWFLFHILHVTQHRCFQQQAAVGDQRGDGSAVSVYHESDCLTYANYFVCWMSDWKLTFGTLSLCSTRINQNKRWNFQWNLMTYWWKVLWISIRCF